MKKISTAILLASSLASSFAIGAPQSAEREPASKSAAAIDYLPNEKPEIKVWRSKGVPMKLEGLPSLPSPKAIFERSASAWGQERYEEAAMLHVLGMIRLRTLASVPHSQASGFERQLDAMSAARSTMVNEWLLGDIPLAVQLIETALRMDEEQLFPDLDELVQEAKLKSKGAKLSSELGRRPYERLAKFLSVEANKRKIYEIRVKQGKPIRDQDPEIKDILTGLDAPSELKSGEEPGPLKLPEPHEDGQG